MGDGDVILLFQQIPIANNPLREIVTELEREVQCREGLAGTSDSTTPFDLTDTVTFVVSFDVSGQDNFPTDVTFSTDGTKMFVTGQSGTDVNEYTLSTAFDLTDTISQLQTLQNLTTSKKNYKTME